MSSEICIGCQKRDNLGKFEHVDILKNQYCHYTKNCLGLPELKINILENGYYSRKWKCDLSIGI